MAIRFHITTHGCRVNRVESDSIAAKLIALGWEQSRLEDADIALLNTCTVTGEADHKNRKAIRQALKRQDGPVLVTGCAINIASDHYQEIDERVVCESDKALVASTALALMAKRVAVDAQAANLADAADVVPYGDEFRTRVGIKVQDGCNNACTFCIVHTARGRAKSAEPAQILQQTLQLIAAGAKELLLVGIDTGAYNFEGLRLAGLIRMLFEKTSVERIRIPSIEPQSITDELMKLMATSNGRLCRHMHLVLQSGSSKVLREMARHYNAAEYLELVARLRTAIPSLALSTDIIVGFPGESEDDFAATCDVAEQCGFMKLHVFPYSLRPETPAAARKDQIPADIKAERVHRLTELGKSLAIRDMESRIGTVEQVVIERKGRGTSESFHEVVFSNELPVGAMLPLRFTGIDDDALVGEPA